jgi:hypothetical protein
VDGSNPTLIRADLGDKLKDIKAYDRSRQIGMIVIYYIYHNVNDKIWSILVFLIFIFKVNLSVIEDL